MIRRRVPALCQQRLPDASALSAASFSRQKIISRHGLSGATRDTERQIAFSTQSDSMLSPEVFGYRAIDCHGCQLSMGQAAQSYKLIWTNGEESARISSDCKTSWLASCQKMRLLGRRVGFERRREASNMISTALVILQPNSITTTSGLASNKLRRVASSSNRRSSCSKSMNLLRCNELDQHEVASRTIPMSLEYGAS